MKFKGYLLLAFVLLTIAWMVFITYCIAQEEYAGALISLSTLVVVMAVIIAFFFKED